METGTMLNIRENLDRLNSGKLTALTIFAIFAAGFFSLTPGQVPRQKTFGGCEEASAALFAAVEKDNPTALLELLGPSATEVISVGDDTEDRNDRQQFVEKYREMHRLVREPDGTTTLYIGAENWPLPVPIAHKNGRWYFDTVASRKEILFRRIGKNEMETVDVCRELVAKEFRKE